MATGEPIKTAAIPLGKPEGEKPAPSGKWVDVLACSFFAGCAAGVAILLILIQFLR